MIDIIVAVMDGTKMPEIKVVYDPLYGYTTPDGKIGEYIDARWKIAVTAPCGYIEAVIGSETILCEMRARHKEGSINLCKYIIYRQRINSQKFNEYEEILLEIDKIGKIIDGQQDFITFPKKH